ncbi:glycosyltransferase [Companilactobacillus allii]|uniref:Glycosyl transferase family 1 n=1 Tax=Companilactobacillus allii TaxID=1847728 RepID=A0A1P8Q2B8_9LACO|nr:glycosyltransferase [Companilactobacillus allii]APX71976.1 hypothetical protein BTM29_05130 [Companilactobacillus allii]USQ69071.1 glycosyltransferase [Companilactobacillus allii]
MEVLEICEAYGGGVKRQIDYLNRFADDKNISMTTLVSSKRGSEIPRSYLVDDDLSEYKHIFSYLSVLRRLHRLITNKKIQLVHAHSTIAGLTMVIYKLRYHNCPPIVFTPHAYFSEVDRGKFKNICIKWVEKFMSKHFAKIIHVSKDEQDYAIANKLVNKAQSVVINNGVPCHEYERLQHPTLNFINVARCDFQKDPQLFIKVAEKITQAIPNTSFTWVGDGPLLNECRAEVIRQNLGDRIKFIGYRNNPYKYLESADIFCSTSRYEGQPFSVLEAISEKLPLLITDVIGHRELVDHNGILLTKKILNDDRKLTDSFSKVIKDKDKLSQASYRLYKSKYDVSDMVDKIEAIYLGDATV